MRDPGVFISVVHTHFAYLSVASFPLVLARDYKCLVKFVYDYSCPDGRGMGSGTSFSNSECEGRCCGGDRSGGLLVVVV